MAGCGGRLALHPGYTLSVFFLTIDLTQCRLRLHNVCERLRQLLRSRRIEFGKPRFWAWVLTVVFREQGQVESVSSMWPSRFTEPDGF